MAWCDLAVAPAERSCAVECSCAEEPGGDAEVLGGGGLGCVEASEDVASSEADALVVFDEAQLFEGVDGDVAVGADAEGDLGLEEIEGGEGAVSEVGLGGGAGADGGAALSDALWVVGFEPGGVDEGEAVVEEAGALEELDGCDAVVGLALADLGGLFAGVDVEGEASLVGPGGEALEGVEGDGADGVGCEADAEEGVVFGVVEEAIDAL